MTPPAKVIFGRNVVSKMAGNPAFPEPVPPLEEISNACNGLEMAQLDAADGGKSKIAIRRQKEEVLDNLLRRLSLWVENVAEGNESLILGAGFEVKRAASPLGMPLQPEGLKISLPGPHGMVYLSWKPVKGTYTYQVDILQGNSPASGEWKKLTSLTRSFFMAEGLTSGQQYWFRVSATGTAGTSGWSDPATVFAP